MNRRHNKALHWRQFRCASSSAVSWTVKNHRQSLYYDSVGKKAIKERF